MKSKMLNRILKTELVDWKKILPLQPDNAKININKDFLKESLLKYGFSMPFYGWEHKGQIYAIDGHTRKAVLLEMDNVPEELPCTFIDAKNKTEAVKILIEVYNQRHNPFDREVLIEFLEVENIEVEEIDIESLNVSENINANDYGTDFSLPEGDKAPFQQMTFTLADEQAEQIKNAIADIKQTEEYKYCETLGNENSNGNALYLIIMQWAEQRK